MEKKCVDGTHLVNYYASYLFYSNDLYSIRVDKHDRRYFVVQTKLTEEQRLNRAFWTTVSKQIANPHKVRCAFDYWANLDISNFQPRDIPMTDMKRLLTSRNIPQTQLFLEWFFSNMKNFTGYEQHIPFKDLENIAIEKNKLIVTTSHFYERYKEFTTETNEKKLRRNIVIPTICNILGAKKSRERFKGSRPECVLMSIKQIKDFWTSGCGYALTTLCFLED